MISQIISQRLNIALHQVKATIALFQEGATIPFISRYRKEVTGSLDEVLVAEIKTQLDKLTELEARKKSILSTIEEQGGLTPELKDRIEKCWDSVQIEDIYLPYKPKRRTRATIARERGLEPLANIIYLQREHSIEGAARRFVSSEVKSVQEAIDGALDIVAERISEDGRLRERCRQYFRREGYIHTKVARGKSEDGAKFSDYFDATSPLRKVSSHRFLAMCRGVDEGILKISIDLDDSLVTDDIESRVIRGSSSSKPYLQLAIKDSYKRLIRPSIESEMLNEVKERADREAIKVFGENLRQLLLGSPLGQKRVLAIDPGFRTGCKVVVLDSQGELLHNTTIYPHAPQSKSEEATKCLESLISRYTVEAVAIGNGTAGRETETLMRSIAFANPIEIYSISEDGASIYSASATAREELGEYDITVRGAVSIGRRLMDPLSELVKIDPKSIGVGQYQHSVDQTALKQSLTTVVESCVNSVGVNINTASKHILTYISGLGPALAENIVTYRAANGEFTERKELLKVKRLGNKAYEQAAGFLRIIDGRNPLDSSAVHPESYYIVEQMARDLGVSVKELVSSKELRKRIEPQRYVANNVGLPTINDILESLDKRGLDPRQELTSFSFDDRIRSIDDLSEGMTLSGLVSNITAFGAFVNIGIKQDGLVHISQLADRYVASPSDVVTLGEQVEVRVIEVDKVRGRISLSMRRS